MAWCGDSRAYWLADVGEARQLTLDHSLGTEMIASGKSREEAEADPTFHTITRWLGADSVDHSPELASQSIEGAGWLLVVQRRPVELRVGADGDVGAAVGSAAPASGSDPVPIAESLAAWANDAGGHDNITAAPCPL